MAAQFRRIWIAICKAEFVSGALARQRFAPKRCCCPAVKQSMHSLLDPRRPKAFAESVTGAEGAEGTPGPFIQKRAAQLG